MNNRRFLSLLVFALMLSFGFTFGQKVVTTDGVIYQKLPKEDFDITFQLYRDQFLLNYGNFNKVGVYSNTIDFKNPEYATALKKNFDYPNFLNGFGDEVNRTYVFAKSSMKKFLVVNFNTKTRATSEKVLDFKLKGQYSLGYFSDKTTFNIVALVKNSRTFAIHTLDENLDFTTHEVDIEKGTFFKDGVLQDKMPKLISYSDDILEFASGKKHLAHIKDEVPNSNFDVTKANKFYVSNGKLKITLDKNKDHTTVVEIDLETWQSSTYFISKDTSFEADNFLKKTNSYLFNDLLFQVIGTKKKVGLYVWDFNKKERKEILVFDRDTPYYADRNLMITQRLRVLHELPSPVKKSEEDVQRRLAKVMKSDRVGLQIAENDAVYLITLGGYSAPKGGVGVGIPVGNVGSFGAITVNLSFYHPGFGKDESLSFFVDKASNELTYSEFEDPYYKMTLFLDEEYDEKWQKKTKWLTKFKIGLDYYLGYMDKKTKIYYFRKFN